MPQTRLPFFPDEIELVNIHIGFHKKERIVYYYNGSMPVFQHCEKDYASFRMFTTQLIVNGNAKQAEVVKAFGVSASSVKSRLEFGLGG